MPTPSNNRTRNNIAEFRRGKCRRITNIWRLLTLETIVVAPAITSTFLPPTPIRDGHSSSTSRVSETRLPTIRNSLVAPNILNKVALAPIRPGDELTHDYGELWHESQRDKG